MHDEGVVKDSDAIILSSTRLYEFCDPGQRGEWLDVLVALIEYLRSGSSRVGYLNNAVTRNMIHKNGITQSQDNDPSLLTPSADGINSGGQDRIHLLIAGQISVPPRRSARKRKSKDQGQSGSVKRNVRPGMRSLGI